MAPAMWLRSLKDLKRKKLPAMTLSSPAIIKTFDQAPSHTVSTSTRQRPQTVTGHKIPRKPVPPPSRPPELRHDVPEALSFTAQVEDDVLLEIIASSIQKVKDRFVEEENAKRQEYAAKLQLDSQREQTALGAETKTDLHLTNNANTPAKEGSSTEADSVAQPAGKEIPTAECVSCLDDVPIKKTIKTDCHHYCRDCFARLVEGACENEQQWPPKCCKNIIPSKTVRSNIPKALAKKFDERRKEWYLPSSERVYCSVPKCSLFVDPKHVDKANNVARCPKRHKTCTICRGPAHPNAECPHDPDVVATEALADEEGWVRCRECNAIVEHGDACQHMTCRCGYQFCYVCKAPWRTCECDMLDLLDKKNAATRRRHTKQREKQEEDEELREVLMQISEREQEMARREEQLQQQVQRLEEERLRREQEERLRQERLEQERQQREREERLRQEKVRKIKVQDKFARLKIVLEDLHKFQKAQIREDQALAARLLEEDTETATQDLQLKHEEERAKLNAEGDEKLRAKQDDIMVEHDKKAMEEGIAEVEYFVKLSDLHAGQEGADEKIKLKMERYKEQMEEKWKMWREWRDKECTVLLGQLETKQTAADERRLSAMRRLESGFAERRKGLVAEKASDWEWVEKVIKERELMLDNLEKKELGNGDDEASL